MNRIFLFVTTNIAVLLIAGIVLSIVFGICGYASSHIYNLLIWATVIGFSGSLISLMMSKSIAVRSVHAVIISEPQNSAEKWLMDTLANLAHQWNVQMPEVAIYDSPEVNAFATGATKNSSLVAVSTGLLQQLSRDEVEAVLAHEMAHVGNGDMVTMTLLQGVINTFVFFWARVIAEAMVHNNKNSNFNSHGSYFLISMILQLVFGFLANFIIMWFSRQREYRADAGSARLVGAAKMIAALQRLKGQTSDLPGEVSALGIASTRGDDLLSSHPSLDNRIARLKQMY